LSEELTNLRPAQAMAANLASAEAEARAFHRLHLRIARTVLRQTAASARLRLVLVLSLSGSLWYGLYRLILEGFKFLHNTIPQQQNLVVHGVFSTFFATLLVMIAFSASIILYASLFRSAEVALLLTLPARDERVFLHKFQEAVVLSSWGFLLLGSPLLVAHGVVMDAPWYYYAMLFPYMIMFVYVPVALGGVLCLEVMYRLPRIRTYLVAAGAVLLVGAAVWAVWSIAARPASDIRGADWFRLVLGRLQLTQHELLPSWWLSSGLLQAANGRWNEAVLFLVVLIANALFFRQVGMWRAAKIYRRAYSTLYDLGGGHKRPRIGSIDRLAGRAAAFLPRSVQLLIIKDLRLFRRDPAQWSQFLVFFGLLALYFLNLRRFSFSEYYSGWVSVVSFLNVSVVGLLMSTFTTRFVFPMVSLEARRFWLLGLLPVRRETVLWGKFAFAIGGSLLPCAALVLVSDISLHTEPPLQLNHQLTCLLLCLGLSGIAVGLGARLPNLREQSPARIAAGFGGTFNLVLSAIYIVVLVLLTTLPCHFYLAAESAAELFGRQEVVPVQWWLGVWLLWGTVASLLVSALATIVPLWVGIRAFRRQEF
jgi:ABC-2 type transport system permease protein